MKRLSFIFCFISIILFSCSDSKKKAESKYGITDSTANALLKIPFFADYKEIKSAEKKIPLAIAYFKETNNEYGEAYCCKLYGFLQNYKGEFKSALSYLLKSYDVFGRLNKYSEKARTCNNIASVYINIGSKDLATKYYDEALEIASEIKDSSIQATVIMNLGINFRKSNPDSALYYYKKALSLTPLVTSDNIRVKIQYNIANIYYDRKENDMASATYQNVLNYGIANNNLDAIQMAYIGLAGVNYNKKNYSKTFQLYDTVFRMMDSLGQSERKMTILSRLIDCYEGIGDFNKAYLETKKLNALSDSLLTKEKELAIHELEIQYQTEKKEAENKLLKKEANVKIILIIALIIIAIVLYILLKGRSKLVKEKSLAYDVLMEKYKVEKLEREKQADKLSYLESTASDFSKIERPLIQKILEFYKSEKPYLNSKLKVDDVARHLNVTQKEIAAAIKSYDNSNFNAFTNRLRVEEARRKFEDPAYDNLKMDVISEQSGFGTIQSFYNAFELYTGVKPAFYRYQMRSN